MIRAFVALPVPAQPPLPQLIAELDGPDVKTTPVEQLHLTLSFLGDVDQTGLAEALDAAVEGLAPFPLRLRGVGAFPHPRKPRVLWVGIDHEPRLDELAHRVRMELPPDDEKPFRAHLTVGRVREEGRPPVAWLRRHEHDDLFAFDAREVRLYKSTLGPRGAQHDVVHVAALEG